MAVNEARAQLRMLPVEGGDVVVPPPPAAPQQAPAADSQPTVAEPPPQRSELTDDELATRRVLFSLTARARHKAKNPAAFVQWIDAGFRDHRDEWSRSVTVTQPEPEYFIAFQRDLLKLAETTTSADLPAAVNEVAMTYERTV